MSSAPDQTIAQILDDLCSRYTGEHDVHTILLYGSRATGQESATSDIDIAAFGPVQTAQREAYTRDGIFVDAFIYPEESLEAAGPEQLKLRNSKILLDLKGRAAAFLQQLNTLYASGPKPLPDDEMQARKAWADKMLLRIVGSGIDARYRRAWLLTDMLEDYFALRGLWYEGPGKSLRWMEENDQETFGAIYRALGQGADQEQIGYAIGLVYELPTSDESDD